MYKQSELPKNVDPKLTSEEMIRRKEEVIYHCTPILTKPKPRVPTTDAPKPEQKPEEQPSEQQQPSNENEKQGDMDVD